MSSPAGSRRIALVDANSFYASAEKSLDPALADRPVVVLSNGEGAIVAASSEAKALGFETGTAWFKVAGLAARHGVVAKSSAYENYGVISNRMHAIIGQAAAAVEPYSVDEAWAFLGPRSDAVGIGRQLRAALLQNLGIPVSIGIAPTKTLAKLVNKHVAKRVPAHGGVVSLDDAPAGWLDAHLAAHPVTDLWGVAGRTGKKLAALGIHSMRDLRDADTKMIRKRFSIVLERTVLELRGIPCIPPDPLHHTKQQLMFSRTFSEPVTTADRMTQVMSIYAQQASGRLRRQGSVAKTMTVFASTSPFGQQHHSPVATVTFPEPTDNPLLIAKAAIAVLPPRMIPGYRYVRAGVMLTGLQPVAVQPMLDLFEPSPKARELGATLDRITRKAGPGSIGIGLAGLRTAPDWAMKRENLSPRAFTHWDELLTVAAK